MATDLVLMELGDGVAAALTAQSFSIPVQGERAWQSIENREDTERLIVSVLPDADESRLQNRQSNRLHDLTIDVCICKWIGSVEGEKDKVDAIGRLAQEIHDFLGSLDNAIVTTNLKASPRDIGLFFVRDELIVDRVAKFYVTVNYQLIR